MSAYYGVRFYCSKSNFNILTKFLLITMGAKLDILTNLQTYKTYKLINAQLQIYLLNVTLSILIAIFSCQIPTTYAMFYKKVSCVLIQYGQLYVPYGMMHRAPVFLK